VLPIVIYASFIPALKDEVLRRRYVPKKFKESSFYNAIKDNPYTIAILPKRYQTYDLCVKAVQTSCQLLKFVTEDVTLLVLKNEASLLKANMVNRVYTRYLCLSLG
jgi:hypothetical protein